MAQPDQTRSKSARAGFALIAFEPRPSQVPLFLDDHKLVFIFSANQEGKTLTMAARLALDVAGEKHCPVALPEAKAHINRFFYPDGSPRPVQARWYCTDLVRNWDMVALPYLLKFIPKECLDTRAVPRSAIPGYRAENHTLYLKGGGFIQAITYGMQGVESEAISLTHVCFDEAGQEELLDQAYLRTRTTAGRIWGAMTLNADSHRSWSIAWVHRRIWRREDGPHVSWHRLTPGENLKFMQKDLRRVGMDAEADRLRDNEAETQRGVSLQQRGATLEGLWSGATNIVYRMFDRSRNGYTGPCTTPEDFVLLAKKGYGAVYAGFDHGKTHATSAPYVFVCRHALPDGYNVVEGDHIQFAEYNVENQVVTEHIPMLRAFHNQYGVLAYHADPRVFDEDQKDRRIPSVAMMYQNAGIGPMFPANNDVDVGIQRLATMLLPRQGIAEWPQYRVLVPFCPATVRGFECWATKPNAKHLPNEEKYEQECKDIMDGVRYLGMAHLEGQSEDRPMVRRERMIMGVPASMYFSMAEVMR